MRASAGPRRRRVEGGPAAREVEPRVGELKTSTMPRAGPKQDGADPRQQLPQREKGFVIVGASSSPRTRSVPAAGRRASPHWMSMPLRRSVEHLPAAQPRHGDIEQDEVRPSRKARSRPSCPSVAVSVCALEEVVLEPRTTQPVVDDQDPRHARPAAVRPPRGGRSHAKVAGARAVFDPRSYRGLTWRRRPHECEASSPRRAGPGSRSLTR